MSRRWDGRVPFDPQTGDLQHYPTNVYVRSPDTGEGRAVPPEWRENGIFEDVLKFQGFDRGRSAAYASFQNADGRTVTMFLTDLSDAMKHMVSGILSGRFTYAKRGANFGIRMVGPEELVEKAAKARRAKVS